MVERDGRPARERRRQALCVRGAGREAKVTVKRSLAPGIAIEANDRIDPSDVYMVSGDCIVRLRDGEVERLEGSEKERVRRWLLRKATP